MARFPKAEAEIVALAQSMVSGLTGNAVLYPAPPVLPAALTTLVSAYTTAKNAAIAAVAAGEAALWKTRGQLFGGEGPRALSISDFRFAIGRQTTKWSSCGHPAVEQAG